MTANHSKSLLSRIHIAKKDLGMDDDTYRAMLKTTTGKTSCAKMCVRELVAVMARLRELGFRDSPAKRHGQRPSVGADRQALIGKIEALLADQGRHWHYADAIAKRVCKKDRSTFCTPGDLARIVAALEYDARRKARQPGDEGAGGNG